LKSIEKNVNIITHPLMLSDRKACLSTEWISFYDNVWFYR